MNFPLILLLVASSLSAKPLEVIRTIPHTGYSEGLDYSEGFLWHALPKEILKIDPKDGSIVARFKPGSEYSESLKWWNGKLYNLSFSDNGIYVAKVANGQLPFERKGEAPEKHAWGAEVIGSHLVVTGDFSKKLYFLDESLKLVKTLETEAKDIEDLAYDGKYIWASSFTDPKGKIFRIDPKTGKAGPFYELPHPEECPIIDGLTFDGKNFWLTGKNCLSIYYIKKP